MVIKGRFGQQLVKETPFTLLALTRHTIEPHEKHWFARCRGDYLRSFPLSLLEMVRLCLLLFLVGASTDWRFTLFAIASWGVVTAVQAMARSKEKAPGFDEIRALAFRAATIGIRSALWCAVLCWGLLIVPAHNVESLAALGLVLMAIDGISVLALPHLALLVSLGAGASVIAGVALREDFQTAAPVAVTVLVMASFLHWSIYNLYYLFATRRIRTRRLSQSNETVQLLLNQYDDEGSDWLYEIDGEGRIANPSLRFAVASGLSVDQLVGMPIDDLLCRGENGDALARKFRDSQPFRNLVISVRVAGEERWWSVSGRPIDDSVGTSRSGWRGFIADVSAAKKAEAKVAFMAHYDLLTHLPNRTLFNAALARAFSRLGDSEALGLLYIDLDHFKAINDSYGHGIGDRVLEEVARRLETTLRPRDMVARLGGDEFVILLEDLDTVDSGLVVAERIIELINEPIEIDGQLMPVGVSVGIAFAPHDASSGEDLLRAADLAMYDAKSRGRRGISIFDADMQVQMLERRQLELDLRVAVVRQELELHYQPLVDLKTGATSGYEALIRWNHPERGQISPVTFIPIAEETGLIVEIGEWVIRNALAEAANWPDHLTVAVNLSPAQMRDAGIVAVVLNALAANNVAASRLELEITESLLMQESADVLAILHSFRNLGVRIALDDFGTGYSSLNYLRSFPFDKIKIDRCFVNELSQREDCQAIVRSVISLANDLNMTTTAEGVEVKEQLDALMNNGCDQVQGFYFSRALPAGELHYGDTDNPSASAARQYFPAPEPIAEQPQEAQPPLRAAKRAAG